MVNFTIISYKEHRLWRDINKMERDYLDRIIQNAQEKKDANKIKDRVISSLDPYGEENWDK